MSTDTHTKWSREQFAGSLKRYPIHPSLVKLAREWATYQSKTTRQYMSVDPNGMSSWVTEQDVPCARCAECDDEILVNDPTGRLGHLTGHHGWRMNGKRYDGQNQILEEL